MVTVSLQMPEEMRDSLKAQAKQSGLTPSRLMRRLLQAGLEGRPAKASLADRMQKLKGCIKRAPKNLSRQKAFED